MTWKQDPLSNPDAESIRIAVLRGIAGHRIPGLQFPSFFLGIQWEKIEERMARLVLPDGPHCRRADGTVDLRAIGVLVDHALATTTRLGASADSRIASVQMQLQFAGGPPAGELHAEAVLLGRNDEAFLPRIFSQATLCANGESVCHASGEFILLRRSPDGGPITMPWEYAQVQPIADANDDLEPHERAIIQAGRRSTTRASAQKAFIEHFWGGLLRRGKGGVSHRIPISPGIGNPTGDVHGGVMLGLAAANAVEAAPMEMMLSNLSVWFIRPGRGSALCVRSRVIHAGRNLTIVGTEMKTAAGETVIEALSHHVARR